ncbi:MAG: hypothetical protein LBV09_06755, partial [Deferribacteraceae bacterium]|nr:hypothetical protein [Deferribacteraceae bacterium]
MYKRLMILMLLLAVSLVACKKNVANAPQESDVTGMRMSLPPFTTTDFTFQLTKILDTERNNVISPLSAAMAMGLVANGADGETLKGFEKLFNVSITDVNDYYSQLLG